MGRYRSVLSFAGVALVLLLYLFVVFGFQAPVMEPDSKGYLTFAQELLDGTVFSKHDPLQISPARAVRTPGYPLMLAAAEVLIGGGSGRILILHSLLGAACLLATALLLRRQLSAPLAAAIVFIGLSDVRGYFPTVLTEWAAICLLIMLFACLVWSASSRSLPAALTLGLLTGCAVLTRPALVVALPVVGFWFLFVRQRFAIKAGGLAALAVLPIAWALCNLHAIGLFGLTAFDGFNYLGVGALIGSPSIRTDDSAEFRQFAEFLNSQKAPAVGQEAHYVRNQFAQVPDDLYNHNLYEVALRYPPLQQIGPVHINELFRQYGLRSIREHPSEYLLYVWRGFQFGLGRKWEWLLGVLIGIAAVLQPRSRPLGLGLLYFFAFHLGHVILVCAVQTLNFRYLYCTEVPFVVAAALAGIAMVSEKFSGISAAAQAAARS